jgi:hypothetical protein
MGRGSGDDLVLRSGGQRDGRDELAASNGRQIPQPGLLVAAGQQDGGGECHRCEERCADQRAAELLEDDRLLGPAEAGTAVAFGNTQAEQIELLGHRRPGVPVEAVGSLHERAHLRLGRRCAEEVAHRLAQQRPLGGIGTQCGLPFGADDRRHID